tara:strand:+ start:559 stop:2088 length:1530 start_codon:yes stop_codon:yes gene_type:complete
MAEIFTWILKKASPMIEIIPINSVYMDIKCERDVAKEISDFFTFNVPGAEYTPAFKYRKWDGKIRLFNMFKRCLYCGLLEYLVKFCEDRGYDYFLDPQLTPHPKIINHKHVEDFFINFLKPHSKNKPIIPHQHQIDAVYECVNKKRSLLLSPTGSGKSLIIYALMRYYQKITNKKVLILVPTTSLVEQMYTDFEDYSSSSDWDVSDNCHKIYSGKDREASQQVTISTWQSLYKMPKEFFDQYGAVFGDECHLYKAKSLSAIMEKLTDCPIRIGTTGTLDGTKAHKLMIEGLFGPVFKAASTKDLIKQDILSDFEIDSILLKYPKDMCESFKRLPYQEEINQLISLEARNDFITDLAEKTKGNTLILFQYVKNHGIPLYEKMISKGQGKVFLVHGGVHADIREEIRHIAEEEDNAVIVASYGTFSTGVSIKKLHNIIFASPSKSRIRVLQSIGRQLRKSDHKNKARLFDISDDLRWKKYVNHTYRHYEERLEIYKSENFDVNKTVINING